MRRRAWTRANSSGCSRRTWASASRPHSTCCRTCRFSRTLERRCSAKSVSPARLGNATVMSRATTRSASSCRSTQAAISRTQSGNGSLSCSPLKGSRSPKMWPPPRHAGLSSHPTGGRSHDCARHAEPLVKARPKVAVMGGSLVGLTAALVLRDIGCDVDVYERSDVPLQGRGVGLVLHPMTARYLLEHALLDLATVSTSARFHRYLKADGAVLVELERRHQFTGYNTLYGALLGAFGRERYHLGHEVVGITQRGGVVELAVAGGGSATADLLVAADGV